MRVRAFIVQFPVSLSIQANLITILDVLERARPWDLFLFPEGAVSGYSQDTAFLNQVDLKLLDSALDQIQAAAFARQVTVWVGAVYKRADRWFNQAYGFTPFGKRQVYCKINLATHERGVFTAGDDLPVFELFLADDVIPVAVQICRELRYPEQWTWLAHQGAKLFLHPNNATGGSRFQPVWRSHLVARAAETQRYVLSANTAASDQTSPTLAIGPDGQVMAEVISGEQSILPIELDMEQVSDLYLDQRRQDIVYIARRELPDSRFPGA